MNINKHIKEVMQQSEIWDIVYEQEWKFKKVPE